MITATEVRLYYSGGATSRAISRATNRVTNRSEINALYYARHADKLAEKNRLHYYEPEVMRRVKATAHRWRKANRTRHNAYYKTYFDDRRGF